MATFNAPPGWPTPPATNWQPPTGWQPDPSWPPAPPGWAFWLNARGLRTRGPSGRYGAEPPVKLVAGWVAGAFAFIVILAAIGGASSPAAVSSAPGARVTVPGPTTTVAGPTVTVAGPTVTVQQTIPGPTTTITQPPLPARTVTVAAPRATTKTTAPVPLARTQSPRPTKTTAAPAEVYYANCSAVRAAGKAPLYRDQPGYASHLDRDDDGVACE